MTKSPKSETNMIEYETRDGIVWIWFNRPHRLNAVIPEMVQQLIGCLEQALDQGPGAVVLAGRGAAFCAGYDLKQEQVERKESAHRRQVERLHDVTRLIRRAPFPVIASVHGYALGNGCEFALASDFVIAADNSQFGFPEVSWGLGVTGGGTALLAGSVGIHVAKNLILGGERFSAERAHQLGIVTLTTAADKLEQATTDFALRIADLPRDAFARSKRAIDLSLSSNLESAYALETEQSIVAGRDEVTKSSILEFSDQGLNG